MPWTYGMLRGALHWKHPQGGDRPILLSRPLQNFFAALLLGLNRAEGRNLPC